MKCIECKWYAGQVNDNYGVCKRYPQIANKSQNDWCGEFLSKIEIVVDISEYEKPITIAQVKRGRKPKE
jgi:hypothetical protein